MVAVSASACVKTLVGLRMIAGPDQDETYRSQTQLWVGLGVLVAELEKGA
jgi:hypothetical protein